MRGLSAADPAAPRVVTVVFVHLRLQRMVVDREVRHLLISSAVLPPVASFVFELDQGTIPLVVEVDRPLCETRRGSCGLRGNGGLPVSGNDVVGSLEAVEIA